MKLLTNKEVRAIKDDEAEKRKAYIAVLDAEIAARKQELEKLRVDIKALRDAPY